MSGMASITVWFDLMEKSFSPPQLIWKQRRSKREKNQKGWDKEVDVSGETVLKDQLETGDKEPSLHLPIKLSTISRGCALALPDGVGVEPLDKVQLRHEIKHLEEFFVAGFNGQATWSRPLGWGLFWTESFVNDLAS